jgi:hypothetical protein
MKTHDPTGRTATRSGDIGAAPATSTTRPYRRSKIAGQFAPRLIEMIDAPPFRVLSLSARRILDRLEIELGAHAGRDNGRLPVTFADFVKYGVERHAVAPAMREVEALGFAQVMQRGRAGNAGHRTPNLFRMTYRPTDAQGATDEWRQIKSIEEAKARAVAARKPIRRKPRNKPKEKKNGAAKNNFPVGENPPSQCGKPPPKMEIPSGGNPHYRVGGETPTTIYISRGETKPTSIPPSTVH